MVVEEGKYTRTWERKLPESVTEQGGKGWFTINNYRKDSPFLSLEVPPPPRPPARFAMPETGEKERNCLFKSYTLRVMA